jgi:hypothetical protein
MKATMRTRALVFAVVQEVLLAQNDGEVARALGSALSTVCESKPPDGWEQDENWTALMLWMGQQLGVHPDNVPTLDDFHDQQPTESDEEHAARRERIATRCMTGLAGRGDYDAAALLAVRYADALIAELDKA